MDPFQLKIFFDFKILKDSYFYPSLSFDSVMKEFRLCDCNYFSWPIYCLQLHSVLLKQLGYFAHINTNKKKKSSLQLALTRV